MGDNRLSKIGILLESKNRTLRHEAAGILSKLSFTNTNLSTIHGYLQNQSWDARVAASEALSGMLKNLPKPTQANQNSKNCGHRLELMSLMEIITNYQPLLSCESEDLDSKSPVILSSREQRNLIDQHLDFNAKVGISSKIFLADEEILLNVSMENNKIHDNKQMLDKKSSECGSETNDDTENNVLIEFIQQLLHDLASQKWQNRHGSALALQKIVIHAFNRLNDILLENIVIRIFEVLALDKFNDFMTGSNAIAPVRESTAQCLCLILSKINIESLFFNSILKNLNVLLDMENEKLWQCRQTALIVFKYYFAISISNHNFNVLFQNVVAKMNDPVDEVVSAAVLALSALFANSKITQDELKNYVNIVMKNVWYMLRYQDNNHAQLKEGVNSLLVDLLRIIELWLKVDCSSNLDNEKIALIVDLFDQSFISRTSQAILCINLVISKRPDLNNEVLYKLVKMLYRVLIFVPPTDSTELIHLCLSTLAQLVEFYEEDISKIQTFQQSIGFWFGCLILDHKRAELDVFMHCVDGPSSSKTSPSETFCSDEMRFLTDHEKNNVFVERKILAARFLSAVINAMYKSGIVVMEQPLYLSIQLVFIPYLRSTSMYQRLGIALALNCWARIYRRTMNRPDLKEPLQYPLVIIKEIEKCVWNPVEVYDEVGSIINFLTSECNEFRQYCIRKGAKKDELPVMNESISMEDVIKQSYEISMKKCRQEDVQALNSRLIYMEDLIKTTKNGIRMNSNRINALLSSSLYYFGYVPEKLTPMIRPLIECADSEENIKVAEEILYDAMPLLLSYTCQKTPCPHPKIIKQLCNGLVSCKNFVPDPEIWSSSEKHLTIISTSQDIEEIELKSKNCGLIVQAISEHFGMNMLNICPDFKTYLSLEKDDDLKQYLLNIEVVRTVSIRLKNLPTESEANLIMKYLIHNNPAIRFRIARCITMWAKIDLGHILNLFYEKILKLLSNIESDNGRCGAIELLYLLSGLEHGLLGATSLLAPLVLTSIGDKVEQIRETAAATFRKLIALLPLEHQDRRMLPNLNETLLKKYHESLDFLNVLSCPGNLPILSKEDIPGLKSDVNLRAYQLEGITWMMFLNRFGLNGILADDMGLGKTLQTLCLLAIQLKSQESLNSSLIVCPKTLVNHWCNEWRKYFPKEKPIKPIEFAVIGKRVTTTAVISYDELKHNFHLISTNRWHYIILDEGHCIRNPNTQLFETITSLVSKHRLILSGTPVQNSPADLWALFRFLMPGYLSTKAAFHTKYMKPILSCRSHKASEQQTKEGEEALNQLHRQVLPFVLRRLKSDVLSELPEKVVQDYMCQLTDVQRKLYEIVVDRCSLKRENKAVINNVPKLSPLHTLIALRKLVDHPMLIEDVLNITGDNAIFNANLPKNQSIELSGKMLALKEILNECQIGREKNEAQENFEDGFDVPALSSHRALIFCQWRSSIDLLARFLNQGDFGADISYLRLDGTIPPNDRQNLVDKFNNDPSIDLLILTTHIGGVGLTLTGADVVIFLDHDWNPVKDLQAIDRAHRLGQTRTVNVYRLITVGSIEEKIMRYQKFKSDTANVLVGSDNRSISSMATDELLELFSLDTSGNGDAQSFDSGPAPSKRKKASIPGNVFGGTPGDKWSLEDLWDGSQYEQQHSISSFIQSASQ